MPLIQGKSKEAFGKNVGAEMDAGKPQKQALAIAFAVKRKNKKAHGGLIENEDIEVPMHGVQSMGNEYEPSLEALMPEEEMEEHLPMHRMAEGGLMTPSRLVKSIMMKRKNYADGGMVMNQGDNMPVNDDIDDFSAETSSEGPLDEGIYEEEREDKITKQKSRIKDIMARLHMENKGA